MTAKTPDMWQSDAAVVAHALRMWANWIETGDPILSSEDAVNCGEKDKIQALSTDQMRMIVRLRDLADRVVEK